MIVIAAILSATGIILGTIHVSCLPPIVKFTVFLRLFRLFCSISILAGAFTAICTIISSPFDIPPRIPPALFVAVRTWFLLISYESLLF